MIFFVDYNLTKKGLKKVLDELGNKAQISSIALNTIYIQIKKWF